ncbi:MAG: hypothetical protein K0S56_3039 [Microvirga sp.]|jgi:glycosyltransferase involved in cell wall biosynthesis|nr:hypothetical protein [Microvirga sp.]
MIRQLKRLLARLPIRLWMATGGRSDLACLVTEVYRQRLHRLPTSSELALWKRKFSRGLRFEAFIDLISDSEEACERHRKPADAAIRLIYQVFLYRSPSDAEVAYCQQMLADHMCFPQILFEISDGEEARTREAADREAAADALRLTHRVYLQRPATDADIEFWQASMKDGLSFARALQAIAGGEEARAREAAEQEAVTDALVLTYSACLQRPATSADVEFWQASIKDGLSFARALLAIAGSEEARLSGYLSPLLAELSDARFCNYVLEPLYGHGLGAHVLMESKKRLSSGQVSRLSFLRQSFLEYARARMNVEAVGGLVNDPHTTTVMGTDLTLSAASWRARSKHIAEEGGAVEPTQSSPYLVKSDLILVSAIASLYKGRKYIERFLDNISSQTLGKNFELIVVDSASPEGEGETIERYMKSFPNIRYKRMDYRIGIYDAWNVGIGLSRGRYLTNTNMDDLRRRDSLELQAATLESLPFVDVVYQDFLYTLDDQLDFEEIARFGFKSCLPIVTANNIFRFNSPHNAPMWRKALHDEIGLFDVTLKSAGDYDFWMRCLIGGKIFYKINIPHVAYFQNPHGISTRPDTLGIEEGRRVLSKHAPRLVPESVFCDDKVFRDRLDLLVGRRLDLDPRSEFYDMAQAALEDLSRPLPQGLVTSAEGAP